MNNNDLVQLVRGFLKNDGVTSNNMRKKMIAKGHPERILQAAGHAMVSRLAADNLPADSDSAARP